jgi:coiled-coil domain-containing protein 40
MNHANKDMVRLNSLISSNQNAASTLEDKYFQLQQAVMSELKDQEAEAKRLENEVTQCSAKKKELLSDVLETEREIMLWERKLQLDREMRELLDPNVGQVSSGQLLHMLERHEMRLDVPLAGWEREPTGVGLCRMSLGEWRGKFTEWSFASLIWRR